MDQLWYKCNHGTSPAIGKKCSLCEKHYKMIINRIQRTTTMPTEEKEKFDNQEKKKKTKVNRELNSVITCPPQEGVGRRKIDIGTPFEINWPKGRVLSRWFFKTKANRRIYLKRGWNLFGSKDTNHIVIQEPEMKYCEMMIYISELDRMPPKMHSINDNCIVNGVRMAHKQIYLRNKSTIGIWVHSPNKLIVLQIRRSSRKLALIST